MTNCPFCNYQKEKMRLLEEKNHVFVILSNPRLMFGHLLVIPKRHVEKLSQLDSKEQKELLETIIEYQEKILNRVSLGCDIRQHFRPFQKDGDIKVSHLHIHLLPRKLYDELYQKSQKYEDKVFKNLSEKEMRKFRNLLGG